MCFSNPSNQLGNNLHFPWIHPCLGESCYQRLTGVGHAWLQTDSRDSWLRFFLLLPFLLKEDLPEKMSTNLKTSQNNPKKHESIVSNLRHLFFGSFFFTPPFWSWRDCKPAISMPLNTGLDPTAWAMGHSGTVVERCWMVKTQKKTRCRLLEKCTDYISQFWPRLCLTDAIFMFFLALPSAQNGRQFDSPLAATITCTGDILMFWPYGLVGEIGVFGSCGHQMIEDDSWILIYYCRSEMIWTSMRWYELIWNCWWQPEIRRFHQLRLVVSLSHY